MSDELILSLLGQVKYPGFSRDIVSFGLVRETALDEKGKATVKLELRSEGCINIYIEPPLSSSCARKVVLIRV